MYLSNQNNEDEEKTKIRSIDTTDGLEGDLVESAAVVSPRSAESDVCQTDGAPGEESSQTGQSLEPSEDFLTRGTDVDVSEHSKDDEGRYRHERATRAINVGEDFRSITLFGERSEGPRSTVNTRDTDRQDGDEDDHVHEVVVTVESTICGNEHKGGCLDVNETAAEEALIVRANQKADKR